MASERRRDDPALVVCWQCHARLRHDQLICAHCGATRPSSQMRALSTGNPSDPPFATDMSRWRVDAGAPQAMYVPGGGAAPELPDDAGFGAQPSPASATFSLPASAQSNPWDISPFDPEPPAPMPAPAPKMSHLIKRQARALGLAFYQETEELWRATGFALLGALIGGGLWLGLAVSLRFEAGFLAIPLGLLVGEGVAVGVTVRRMRYRVYSLALVFFFWAVSIRFLESRHLYWSPLDATYLFFALFACTTPVDHLPMRAFRRSPKTSRHPM